jgi:hypothetical protein
MPSISAIGSAATYRASSFYGVDQRLLESAKYAAMLLAQSLLPIGSPWAVPLISMDLGHHEFILASGCG